MTGAVGYGLDFGTSNSSIAIAYPDRVEVVTVDQSSPLPYSLSSLVYVHRDGNQISGKPAANAFAITGAAPATKCASCDRVSNCHQFGVGHGCKDSRLMSSVKSFLVYEKLSTHSWGRNYSLPDLVSIVLRDLKRLADRESREDVKKVVLGHPVVFEGAEGPGFQRLQDAAIDQLVVDW